MELLECLNINLSTKANASDLTALANNLGGTKFYNALTGASNTKVRVQYSASRFNCLVFGEQNTVPVAFIVTNGNSSNLTGNGSIYMDTANKYFIINLANYSSVTIISSDNLTVTTQT